MKHQPNFFLLLFSQLLSVLGDSLGQRANRVKFKKSRKKMLIATTIVSSIQVFVVLIILEYTLPPSLVSRIYINNKRIQCYQEIDYEFKDMKCTTETCTPMECPRGGPITMFKLLFHEPIFLVNGVLNLLYYSTTFMLYKEPLGLIILVLASLTSSFLIVPINKMFGSPSSTAPIPPYLYILGIIGSLFCIIERPAKEYMKEKKQSKSVGASKLDKSELTINLIKQPLMSSSSDNIDFQSMSYENEDGSKSESANTNNVNNIGNHSDSKGKHQGTNKKTAKFWKNFKNQELIRHSLAIFIPYIIQAIIEASWFVLQVYYNNYTRSNVFTYTSLDQILLPFYIFPFIIIVDAIKPLKKCIFDGTDTEESTIDALKGVWKEAPWITLFFYRFFSNTKQVIYYYLAILYDLNSVYLQLTFIRVILSWIAALVLSVFIPKLIGTTAEERNQIKSKTNIINKSLGTIFIVISLIILNITKK
ncbi:hypothetical protein M0812_23115 [Anaeramoeba flamelloides]|uniref:Uncharacterized protein n=1 Tax=Anaeramoeba flamelloides TaxID=1746091 RepID=A0AAV7YMY6_9EUKA|nr:hypothetical protein M0812_23115 [Anaeramoeba flamelloides]